MTTATHAAAMDAQYRLQRHLYDATRKYYLFGRDRLIDELACAPGDRVLEVGCGTGRNLARVAARWPGTRLFGLDISAEMLKSARRTLGGSAELAQGDATGFDAATLFGTARFERVFVSFALSMIPDWRAAIEQAANLVAPGGTLSVVDFGAMDGMGALPRRALIGWLARFNVTPRSDLENACLKTALQQGLTCEAVRAPLGYYALVRLQRRG